MLVTLTSPEVAKYDSRTTGYGFSSNNVPTRMVNGASGDLNAVIQLAPVRSAIQEIIQQQGLATATWKGSCDRLANIMQPTLLIVGDQDLLAPASNSVMMAQRIPNSSLVIIE